MRNGRVHSSSIAWVRGADPPKSWAWPTKQNLFIIVPTVHSIAADLTIEESRSSEQLLWAACSCVYMFIWRTKLQLVKFLLYKACCSQAQKNPTTFACFPESLTYKSYVSRSISAMSRISTTLNWRTACVQRTENFVLTSQSCKNKNR